MDREDYRVAVLRTSLGWMAILRHEDRILRLSIGHASSREATERCERGNRVKVELDPEGDSLCDDLKAYADGEPRSFDHVLLDLDHLTPFGRRVLHHCCQIEYGQTLTYGQLAALAGSTGAARAVGSTMADNRYPIIVPCHRVLGAGGAMRGFNAPQGIVLKRRMLEMESANQLFDQPLAVD